MERKSKREIEGGEREREREGDGHLKRRRKNNF